MGPKQSSDLKSKQQEFLQKYEIIQELPNENIRFLEHKSNKKEYLLRELSYTSKQQYQKAIQTIKTKRQQLKNADHVVPLSDFFQKQEDQYCSTFYKLYVLYEYPQRTMDDQINERNLRKNSFTETQLWSILASCILGLSHLQKKGIKHGSLRSSMIFLSQEGLIKISDPFTTGCQTNYQTLLNKRNTRHIYLSPQQCEALQGQQISPVHINVYKSDIFTLGMIILECGLLQYQDQCYRDQYSRIHMETLEYNKNRFRKNYSSELFNMLNYMLGEEPSARPEWIQLENYVITDETRLSMISNGKNSVIMTQSKPASVNQKNYSYDPSQNGVNSQSVIKQSKGVNFLNRQSVAQKPQTQQTTSMVSNKGIGLSSLKPSSVKKVPTSLTQAAFVPKYNQTSGIRTGYRPANSYQQVQLLPSMSKPSVPSIPLYQNYPVPAPLPNLSSSVSNLPNVSKPFIAESPIKSQILSKNFDIPPANVSNVSSTRPFKSVFPNPFYLTKTKVDQNLVQVEQDESTSRTASEKNFDYRNIENHNSHTELAGVQHNYTSFLNSVNQSPYHNAIANFTPNQNTFPGPSLQQNKNLHSNFQLNQGSEEKFTQGEFVIETFKLGSRYEGYKVNGMRHGKGKFFYQDGGMYDGDWVKNKMEGYGKLYYQSGKIAYDGYWVQDQFTGPGILYNQNPDLLNEPFNYQNFDNVDEIWTKYQGQFLEDCKNGHGVLYLSNGEFFEGNFVNDTAQGEGVYTASNGKKIRGLWEGNILIKQL